MIFPLPFVWPYAIAFWVVFVWAFVPEWAVVRKAQKSEADAGSMRVIVVGNQLAMFLAFLAPFLLPIASIRTHRVAVFWAGLSLLIAGSLLRRHCFRILGKFFTGAVTVQSDHAVIDQGAYRWVRHPSYTAGIVMFTGMGIALGNWISVATLLLEPIAAYAYRVKVEERALLESLGEPYRAYMQRTRKRFVPFVV